MTTTDYLPPPTHRVWAYLTTQREAYYSVYDDHEVPVVALYPMKFGENSRLSAVMLAVALIAETEARPATCALIVERTGMGMSSVARLLREIRKSASHSEIVTATLRGTGYEYSIRA